MSVLGMCLDGNREGLSFVTFSLYWDKYNKRTYCRFVERSKRDEEQILDQDDSVEIY